MNSILRKMKTILVSLSNQGVSHTMNLIYIYSILPSIMQELPRLLILYKKIKLKIDKHFVANYKIIYWRKRKDEVLKFRSSKYLIKTADLWFSTKNAERLRKLQTKSDEVVIAEIDQNGFLLSHFGIIKNLPMISSRDFLKRNRFTLKIVSKAGYLGVKKNYMGNKLAFINEFTALYYLQYTNCNIPSIMDVDFSNLTLTVSYILGPVLREELAQKTSCLRDGETENNCNLSNFDKSKKWLNRIQEAQRFLYDVVDPLFVENFFEELMKFHENHFLWNDLKYGNIIIEEKSGNPYLIDFDRTGHYANLHKSLFRVLCDQEIEMFNLHFNTHKMTSKKIKEEIKKFQKGNIHSPVYFGAGLKMGDLWKTEVGYGRWHYILKSNLPNLSGKRFLDLGANNAFYSIQMLRNGANEAIGIELNEKCIEQGVFVKRGFEWADKRKYNFKYIHTNMKNIMGMDLGKFDMVMALCCIYYLDDASIADLVQHISTITDVFIIQCNTEINIGRSDPHTYQKASVEYNLQVLKTMGSQSPKSLLLISIPVRW